MTQPDPVAGAEESTGQIIDLVREIAKALVDSPESVSVEAIPDTATTVIRLHVAPSDIGKVIGKQGRTARSLRTILSAASMKLRSRYALDIVEDHSNQQGEA